MILAALDVGTNSVKLLVGRLRAGRLTPVLERAVITRLGEGLQKSGLISQAAADRTLTVLAQLRRAAERAGASRLAAVGTLALRRARNGRDFVRRAAAEAGVEIRIIDGQEEARLAFRGVSTLVPRGPVVSVDIGGGSVQISSGRDGRLRRAWSLPLGAVVMTERFISAHPVPAADIDSLRRHVERSLRPLARLRTPELVGIGGTVSLLAKLLRTKTVFELGSLQRLLGRLAVLGVRERVRRGVPRGRADIIIAGALVLLTLLRRLGAGRVLPCFQGLRHGLLAELAGI